jgi:phage protein D
VFKYLTVDFPTVDPVSAPSYLLSFELAQSRYSHEVGVLKFRDWGVQYSTISAGTPVHLTMYNGITPTPVRHFYGYVHHAKPIKSPLQNHLEVTVISSSWVMKNEVQNTYIGMSADAIISSIAAKYKFASYTVPHPRIYPQVNQAGISDWGLMVKLAKQCGYSLRTENTELYFEPVLHEYTNYRSQAPIYTMRDGNNRDGWNIYNFEPVIGESMPYDDETKSAPAISGLDRNTISPIAHTRPTRNKKTNSNTQIEFFDRFDTHIVANNSSVAQYEAQAAEDRASFPYRATLEVKGDHSLHPNMPIFLKGVGPEYETFWVVLSVEHIIKETSRNLYVYTTKLVVGADSLGAPVTWSDNQLVLFPSTAPTRTIVSGATQTVIIPQTKLSNSNVFVAPQLAGSFGNIKNRSSSVLPAPTWITGTSTLNPILTPVGSQAPQLAPKTLIGTVI